MLPLFPFSYRLNFNMEVCKWHHIESIRSTHGPFRSLRMYGVEQDRWLLPITTKANLSSEVDLVRAGIMRQANVTNLKKREKKGKKRGSTRRSSTKRPFWGRKRGETCGGNVRIICVLDSLLLSFVIGFLQMHFIYSSHMALLIPSASI